MDGGVGVASSSSRYWCYNCEHIINPVRIGSEMVQCPLCQGGFVEDVASSGVVDSESDPFSDFLGTATAAGGGGGGGGGSESDRALSLWAPILLGMMSNPRRRRRLRRRLELEDEEDEENNNNNNNQSQHGVESMDPRRRRRSSATILQLLQGIRAGMLSESENNNRRRESSGDRDRENSILINPFDHSIILNGSSFNSENRNNNRIGSLGDYFVGPGLDLLLQHLAENDPNRYGTPPAQKEVVETMPIVKISDNLLQCSICLDDFEVGKEAKEMPCKHKFHSGCILPWLKLHSSCPVCRYQLPFDEPKVNNNNNNNNAADISGIVDDIDGINRRRFSMPLPWPLSSLFSSPGSSSASSSGPETSSHSSHHTDNEN